MKLFICIKMDLALINLQKLTCHKTQTNKQANNSLPKLRHKLEPGVFINFWVLFMIQIDILEKIFIFHWTMWKKILINNSAKNAKSIPWYKMTRNRLTCRKSQSIILFRFFFILTLPLLLKDVPLALWLMCLTAAS